jgi:hypothetical protein
MKYLVSALILLGLVSSSEARHRHPSSGLHPMCNITMPCESPATVAAVRETQRVARGRYVARQMGFGGVAPKRHARRHTHQVVAKGLPGTIKQAGNGVVKAATGAVAYVAEKAVSAFQCLVSKLEGQGYTIKFMGGFANHGHVWHSLHYAGLALDVNQVERNVTKPPMPSNEITLANSCGLISGAQWANGDSGHFQLGGYVGSHRHYARRRHHTRYANR